MIKLFLTLLSIVIVFDSWYRAGLAMMTGEEALALIYFFGGNLFGIFILFMTYRWHRIDDQ